MTNYVIRGIPHMLIDRMWHLAEPFVKRALDHSAGEIAAADLKAACEKRDAQLWLVKDADRVVGAAVTEIVFYPQRKHCIVMTMAGSHFPEWMSLLDDTLSAWATAQGCIVIEAHVRRGLVPRLAPLGYKHLHSVVYKPIVHNQNTQQQTQHAEMAGG